MPPDEISCSLLHVVREDRRELVSVEVIVANEYRAKQKPNRRAVQEMNKESA
jgi:hypothetical protein